MSHAFLPSSGASSWSRCAAWPTMNERFPSEDSPAASEGTAAHWVAWEIYAGRTPAIGSLTPNGQSVTEEMIDGGELVAQVIREKCGDDAAIETSYTIPAIGPDCFGTPDAAVGSDQKFIVIDYKFGHKFVDEIFNLQGLLYAIGVYQSMIEDARMNGDVAVEFTIVQPRCFFKESVRTHTYTFAEAEPYIRTLQNMAQAARLPNPIARVGEQCVYCPGRHACNALQQAAHWAADFAQDVLPLELNGAQAARELRTLEDAYAMLENRVEALRGVVGHAIIAGERVPFYKNERANTRRKWGLGDAEVLQLGEVFGVDLVKPNAPVSPAKAEKLGVDKAVIEAYSFKPEGENRLVLDNKSAAIKAFGN